MAKHPPHINLSHVAIWYLRCESIRLPVGYSNRYLSYMHLDLSHIRI